MDELEAVQRVALWGFMGAMLFGAIGNATQFCIMGSISDWIYMGSRIRFRAWMLALGIAVFASQLMHAVGWFDLTQSIYVSPNFGWLGYIIGGVIFGIGMTLGSGCGQRTLVRTGNGNLKSLVVLLVLAITAYTTLYGLLAIIRLQGIEATSIDLSEFGLEDQSLPTLITFITGMDRDISRIGITLVISLTAFWYAFKDGDFRASTHNMIAGVMIGVLVAGAWYVTGVLGADDFDPVPLEALTFIAPVGNTISYIMTYTGAQINFGIAVVFGILAGSFLYGVITGSFRIEGFADKGDLVNHIIAGMMMGFGGVLSLGCTIGQGVSGVSTLALGSFITLAAIIFGAALTLKMQYYLLDEQGFFSAVGNTLADFHLLPKSNRP